MKHIDRILLIVIALQVIGASHNAREAHRHTHELACHVGADHLCSFHEDNHD